MRWASDYSPEIDRAFYYEFDAKGRVVRQVELSGPERRATAAADSTEWNQALLNGTDNEYYAEFGLTADMPLQAWEGAELEDVTESEFESIWSAARGEIMARRQQPSD